MTELNSRNVTKTLLVAGMMCVGLLMADELNAQDDSAIDAPAPTLAEQPYIDGSFGFSLRPPAGCIPDYEKKQLAVEGVEVVRFIDAARNWELAVWQLSTEETSTAAEISRQVYTALQATTHEIEVVENNDMRVNNREAHASSAGMIVRSQTRYRQQVVVTYKPTHFFAVILVTPAEDRARADEVFEEVIESFKILRTAAHEKILHDALIRGKTLLREAAGKKRILALNRPQRLAFRFLSDGQEFGFLQIGLEETVVNTHRGVGMSRLAWLFHSDTQLTQIRQDTFVSHDLEHEQWQNQTLSIQLFPDSETRPVVQEDFDNAIRTDEILVVKYSEKPGSIRTSEKVLELEDSYAPSAWDVFFPRMVDLTQQETYGFSWYDTKRHGLVLLTFRVDAPTRISIGGRPMQAYKIERSEGLIAARQELFVNDRGELLRVKPIDASGGIELERTTLESIDSRYADKVEAIHKRLWPQRTPKRIRPTE